jgi:hypothetical protein
MQVNNQGAADMQQMLVNLASKFEARPRSTGRSEPDPAASPLAKLLNALPDDVKDKLLEALLMALMEMMQGQGKKSPGGNAVRPFPRPDLNPPPTSPPARPDSVGQGKPVAGNDAANRDYLRLFDQTPGPRGEIDLYLETEPRAPAEAFVGLTEQDAMKIAKGAGMLVRVNSRDGKPEGGERGQLADIFRVNLDIEGGRVTQATVDGSAGMKIGQPDRTIKPDAFVGLSEQDARNVAERSGMSFRVVARDGQGTGEDAGPALAVVIPDRLTVHVEGGRVSEAFIS